MADFVDTNVLVYAWDGRDPRKQARAREVLAGASGPVVWSTQVLQEFYVAMRRLPEPPDAAVLREVVAALAERTLVQVDGSLVVEAIDAHRAHTLSFWDALILVAARRGGCRRLLTEDLQDGAELLGVRVVNPFR